MSVLKIVFQEGQDLKNEFSDGQRHVANMSTFLAIVLAKSLCLAKDDIGQALCVPWMWI